MERMRGLEDCIAQLLRLDSGAQDKDGRAEENRTLKVKSFKKN